ncbi:MAG TPA: Type 1 glutamine amidotransferase-like domain-containing protein [Ktedonobacterales bacterium]
MATPIALVGSGEYTAAMRETDARLIETLGGPSAARVALLPTASGREPGSPARWNAKGLAHFQALGVSDIRPSGIIDPPTAHDPAQVELLRGANFFYFSGGDPQQIIESMDGSPAWDVIAGALREGAVVAGCSAGAMALGAFTISVRRVEATGELHWVPALGFVRCAITFPHYDRMRGFVSAAVWQRIHAELPAGMVGLGIDEDTALVRLDSSPTWQVMGHQTVTAMGGAYGRGQVFGAGETITLPEG